MDKKESGRELMGGMVGVFFFLAAGMAVGAKEKILAPVPLELVAAGTQRLSWGSQIALSSDGQWVAFATMVREEKKDKEQEKVRGAQTAFKMYSDTGVPIAYGRRMRVMVIDTHSGKSIELGSPEHWSWAPVWSPDETKLAFFSDEDGEAGL